MWVVLAGILGVAGPALWINRRTQEILGPPLAPEDLDREPCVLYLRPRPGDAAPRSPQGVPLERDLDVIFYQDGPLVTASDPDDMAQLFGVLRLPLPRNDAKAVLTEALPRAHLVLIPACGSSPDTLWQLTEAVRLVPPS
ncbi:hypothetical protein WJ438_38485 [Streptomyces sp. GD-15H]|uniref:hypothetical protein n=1 Tax=Streptomyces sp. GD-15H TaxID=3129112 RepID=UPI0032493359